MTIGEVNVVLAGQQSLNAGIIDLNTFAVFEFKASGLTHAAEMKPGTGNTIAVSVGVEMFIS